MMRDTIYVTADLTRIDLQRSLKSLVEDVREQFSYCVSPIFAYSIKDDLYEIIIKPDLIESDRCRDYNVAFRKNKEYITAGSSYFARDMKIGHVLMMLRGVPQAQIASQEILDYFRKSEEIPAQRRMHDLSEIFQSRQAGAVGERSEGEWGGGPSPDMQRY